MLISKFNVYKTEWLELVFAKRNKEYGAYYLRQHYSENLVKAMLITFCSIISAVLITGMIIKVSPIVQAIPPIVEVPLSPPPIAPPKVEPQRQRPLPSKPADPIKTIKFVTMVPTDRPEAIDPPKLIDLTEAIGPVTTNNPGSGTVVNAIPAGTGGGDVTSEPVVDNTVHKFVEVMPEPYGGSAGWTKFLQKNLKYPPQAMDSNISGRVYVSFVVEKDGQLSNITIDRGAGYGMDEEAARVLKLAHAWKPGMQNGQPVRVKFTLPISFSLSN